MMNRHLDVLFANCVKNYIHFCVLNYFSSLNMNREATNKSFIKLPIDLEELQRDGYFGKHCNFPDSVLIAAGGVAQLLAGTSEYENWYVFLDDPRDTYRVMQGIEIYEEEN